MVKAIFFQLPFLLLFWFIERWRNDINIVEQSKKFESYANLKKNHLYLPFRAKSGRKLENSSLKDINWYYAK